MDSLNLFINGLLSRFSEGKYVFYSSLTDRISYFFLFVLLARTLNLNDYGFLVTILVFSNILYSFFDLGFQFYFQRSAAYDSPNIRDEINQVFSFKTLLYPVYLFIAVIYFRNSSTDDLLVVFFISLSTYLYGFSSLFNSVFLGKKLYRIFFQNILISRILMVLFVVGFVFSKADLPIICISFLIGAGSHTLLNLFQLRKITFTIRLSAISLNTVRNVLKSSALIGTGILFVIIYDRVDVLLIEEYLGYSFVAFYAVAYSLYKIPQIIAGMILVPAFTNFSNDYSKKGKISRDLLRSSVVSLLIICVIFCLIYFIASEYLIIIIYGKSYGESSQYLQLLILAVPAIIMNNFTGILLNSIKKEKVPLSSTFLGMLINVFLCILLIPSIGIKGAVISTIITEYFVFFFQLVSIVKINRHSSLLN